MTLINLLIVAVVIWAAFAIAQAAGVPVPAFVPRILLIVVGALIAIWLIKLVVPMLGVG